MNTMNNSGKGGSAAALAAGNGVAGLSPEVISPLMAAIAAAVSQSNVTDSVAGNNGNFGVNNNNGNDNNDDNNSNGGNNAPVMGLITYQKTETQHESELETMMTVKTPVMVPLSSIYDMVEDEINEGLDVTVDDLKNKTRRKDIVFRVLTRCRILRKAVLETWAHTEASDRSLLFDTDYNKELKTQLNLAERELPKIIKLPPVLVAAILAKAGALKLMDVPGKTRAEMAMIYRRYEKVDGCVVPTIWRVVDNTKDTTEIGPFLDMVESSLTKTDRLLAIEMLRERMDVVDGEVSDLLVFCKNGVYDMREAKFDPVTCKNNGVFVAYGSKEFDEKYGDVYPVAYNSVVKYIEDAPCPTFKSKDGSWDWSPLKNGVDELFNDTEEGNASRILVRQMLQALVRRKNFTTYWLFANGSGDTGAVGNAGGGNGKSTLTGMYAQLVGPENVLAVDLWTMGNKNFPIEGLESRAAIISKELKGAGGSDAAMDADLFKLLCRQQRGAVIPIERKCKPTLYLPWRGFCVQELNGTLPRFRDASDSVYRGMQVLKFEKSFVSTTVNKREIQDDFIFRPETAQYLLYYALRCLPVLDGYDKDALKVIEGVKLSVRSETKTSYRFLDENIMYKKTAVQVEGDDGLPVTVYRKNMCPLSVIPYKFLFRWYQGWCYANGYGHPMGDQRFRQDVETWAGMHPDEFKTTRSVVRMPMPKGLCEGKYYRVPVDIYAEFYWEKTNRNALKDRTYNAGFFDVSMFRATYSGALIRIKNDDSNSDIDTVEVGSSTDDADI